MYQLILYDYFFKKEKINYTSTSFSVLDFYTPSQRQKLKLICESIGMKDVNIFTESSAITMYYKYTKYKDINFRGRNFDNLIGKHCLKEVKQINKFDKIELNDKKYYRLIEQSIKDNRKNY